MMTNKFDTLLNSAFSSLVNEEEDMNAISKLSTAKKTIEPAADDYTNSDPADKLLMLRKKGGRNKRKAAKTMKRIEKFESGPKLSKAIKDAETAVSAAEQEYK